MTTSIRKFVVATENNFDKNVTTHRIFNCEFKDQSDIDELETLHEINRGISYNNIHMTYNVFDTEDAAEASIDYVADLPIDSEERYTLDDELDSITLTANAVGIDKFELADDIPSITLVSKYLEDWYWYDTDTCDNGYIYNSVDAFSTEELSNPSQVHTKINNWLNLELQQQIKYEPVLDIINDIMTDR